MLEEPRGGLMAPWSGGPWEERPLGALRSGTLLPSSTSSAATAPLMREEAAGTAVQVRGVLTDARLGLDHGDLDEAGELFEEHLEHVGRGGVGEILDEELLVRDVLLLLLPPLRLVPRLRGVLLCGLLLQLGLVLQHILLLALLRGTSASSRSERGAGREHRGRIVTGLAP